MSFLAKTIQKIEGDWGLIVAQQSPGALDAAHWFAEEAFVQLPSVTETDAFEEGIRIAQQANRLLLLSIIDQPYLGDLETHGQWQSLTNYIFTLPLDLGYKNAHPTWHPFDWQG